MSVMRTIKPSFNRRALATQAMRDGKKPADLGRRRREAAVGVVGKHQGNSSQRRSVPLDSRKSPAAKQ